MVFYNIHYIYMYTYIRVFLGGTVVKKPHTRDTGLIPGSGRSLA